MSKGNGLPRTWTRVPLGELGKWYGGGTPSKAVDAFWTNGDIPWFSPKDMKSFRLHSSEDRVTRVAVERGNIDLFEAGTVLMVVRSGILAHTFPVSVASVAGTMNQDIKGLLPSRGVSASYIAYALRNFGRDILHACSKEGTTVHSIETPALHRFEVPIAPSGEQRRIVRKLDELLSDLDAGVAALERARANLKRYRAAVLKAAVEGRLTEKWRAAHPDVEPASKLLDRILVERRKKWEEAQLKKYAEKGQSPPKGWKERYPAPIGPDLSDLPDLPSGWCWATVDQLAEVQGGIQKQPSRAPRNNSFPYLRVGNVLRDRLDLTRVERFELLEGELEKLRLVPGDLLIVEGNGSKFEIGRAALWRGEIENCVHQNHIIRVRLIAGKPEYLNAYWNSPPGAARVLAQAASTSGLYTLSVGKVSALAVPVPPLDEQEAILKELDSRLSLLEHQAELVGDSSRRSSRLRQAILKIAFEGKLVPQDPEDEPASELLARIRARRAEKRKAKGRARRIGGAV